MPATPPDMMTPAFARSRIAELDLEMDRLRRSLDALSSERESLHRLLADYKYPVLTLPSEVMSEIFTHFLPSHPIHPELTGPHSPSFLLQICRKWRDIAIATPVLRSTMVLNFDNPALHVHQLHLLDAWLKRSGNRPLSIELYCLDLPQWPDSIAPFIEAIANYASRWQDLELCLPYRNLLAFNHPMPLLRTLEIGATEDLEAAPTPVQTPIAIFTQAPCLRNVVLPPWFDPSNIALPWAQLTSVRAKMCPEDAADVLRHCVALKVFECAVHNGYDVQIAPIPPLLALRWLKLEMAEDDDEETFATMHRLLRALSLPALETIAVAESFLGPDPIATLSALRPSGYPTRIRIFEASRPRSFYKAAFPDVVELKVERLDGVREE